jgi:alpha-beta hydrolase superfamily lysophospholipase
MKTQQFMIDQIPAVLYGEYAEKLWLFLHGQMGHKEEAEAFVKIVCPKGAQVLGIDLPGHGARQGRDEALNPWTVVPELLAVMDWARVRWNSISLRANSIGAYFAMLALDAPDKALLVSPILDMERLILDMMGWANVTERELSEKGEIVTSFGQTLSWAYLCYVREHPIHDWHCPICILYAGQDNMTSRQTVEEFTRHHGAQLTIMDNGEHWFHTPEQRKVLQTWEDSNT